MRSRAPEAWQSGGRERLEEKNGEPTLSTDEVLEACTQVYPVEVSEPAGLEKNVRLRPYQKQSLAFMLDVERSTDATLIGRNGTRGGFLCDEMGMGKTAVLIALVVANPCAAPTGRARRWAAGCGCTCTARPGPARLRG